MGTHDVWYAIMHLVQASHHVHAVVFHDTRHMICMQGSSRVSYHVLQKEDICVVTIMAAGSCAYHWWMGHHRAYHYNCPNG